MIRLKYLTPWDAHWQADTPAEAQRLIKAFTFTDVSDLYHKKQYGYFPEICHLDDLGQTITHGQIMQAEEMGFTFHYENYFPRFQVETGPIPEDFLPGVKLRDYQRLAMQVAAGKGHGMVCIDTGGGKTVVMGGLLRILLDNTNVAGVLVLINSKDLLNQTAKRFNQYGVPMEDIGIVHSDISPAKQAAEAEKRVVLSTHMSIKKYAGTINRCQYVLCDEAHECVGPLWSDLIARLPNMLNCVGFTATPWETVDQEYRMRAIFGRKLVEIPAWWLIKQGYLMEPEIIIIKLEYGDRDREVCANMSWQEARKFFVEEDKNRNLLPVATLNKIGGRMLLLYDRVPHGKHVQELYQGQGINSMLADGSSSTKKRDAAINWFEQDCDAGERGKVLLGSKIFDQGTDISGGCDSLFILGAAKGYRKTKQRVGRALRKNRSGKLYIFDVRDSNHRTLSAWSTERKRVYKELKCPIREVTLSEFIKMQLHDFQPQPA